MATMSKAAAKVAGKAKGAAKALAGYPKIFNHLAAEHAELATLMKRVSASADDSSVREELFPDICKNLLAHAHAEEKEFYPVLEEFPELKSLVDLCFEDHDHIEDCLDELDAVPMDTTTWMERFERLVNAVTRHVEREENELFPVASELVSRQQSDEMYDSFESFETNEKEALAAEYQHP